MTVEFALSDLEDDGRTAKVMIEANGQMVMETYTSADMPEYVGDELLIDSLTLTGVPGNVSSIDVTFISEEGTTTNPSESGGDSFFGSGASVTADDPPDGGQGCTPGYWRQEHHFDSWTNHLPGDSFEALFVVDARLRTRGGPGSGRVPTVEDPTLLGAVWAAGGGQNALARHAVAAVLNANSPGVAYAFTQAEIIALVQDAYDGTTSFNAAKNLLVAENEMGCGLN